MYKPKKENIEKWKKHLESLDEDHPVKITLSKEESNKNEKS
jgi:hypothetical protein